MLKAKTGVMFRHNLERTSPCRVEFLLSRSRIHNHDEISHQELPSPSQLRIIPQFLSSTTFLISSRHFPSNIISLIQKRDHILANTHVALIIHIQVRSPTMNSGRDLGVKARHRNTTFNAEKNLEGCISEVSNLMEVELTSRF